MVKVADEPRRNAARRAAWLAAIAIGAAVVPIAYAAARAAERALFLEPNPAMLIWSDQSPFVWRAAIALYVGGAAVFGGRALAARAPRTAARCTRTRWLAARTASGGSRR